MSPFSHTRDQCERPFQLRKDLMFSLVYNFDLFLKAWKPTNNSHANLFLKWFSFKTHTMIFNLCKQTFRNSQINGYIHIMIPQESANVI